MSLFLCFVRAPFKLAPLNWMPLDKYWILKKKINTSTILSTQRWVSYLCQWRLPCHRMKLLSLCSKLTNKLKCKEIIFLTNNCCLSPGDCYNIWNVIATSTTLSTQRWINRIATSHSKMGVLLVSMKVALSSNKAVTYILVFQA